MKSHQCSNLGSTRAESRLSSLIVNLIAELTFSSDAQVQSRHIIIRGVLVIRKSGLALQSKYNEKL